MATSNSSPSGLLLLCIDLQPVFLKGIPDAEILQRRCAFAIQSAAGFGIEVVFTEQVPQKLGGTAPELLSLTERPKAFGKSTFSAFGDDGIREAVLGHNVEHILLCGVETSICVYQTALDALSAGVQVTLLSDCLGARRQDDAAVCLNALTRAGAHLLPSEAVFYAMMHGVQHPFFKKFTQLVKNHTDHAARPVG